MGLDLEEAAVARRLEGPGVDLPGARLLLLAAEPVADRGAGVGAGEADRPSRSTARSSISAGGVAGWMPSGGQIFSRTSLVSGRTNPRSSVAAIQASSRFRSAAIRS
jgi:hypothetical protein